MGWHMQEGRESQTDLWWALSWWYKMKVCCLCVINPYASWMSAFRWSRTVGFWDAITVRFPWPWRGLGWLASPVCTWPACLPSRSGLFRVSVQMFRMDCQARAVIHLGVVSCSNYRSFFHCWEELVGGCGRGRLMRWHFDKCVTKKINPEAEG